MVVIIHRQGSEHPDNIGKKSNWVDLAPLSLERESMARRLAVLVLLLQAFICTSFHPSFSARPVAARSFWSRRRHLALSSGGAGGEATPGSSDLVEKLVGLSSIDEGDLADAVVKTLRAESANSNRLTPSALSKLQSEAPRVFDAIRSIQEASLSRGAEVLRTLLASGEVKVLDGNIAKAAREGQLDEGFFSVMNLNLEEARKEEESTAGAATAEDGAPTDGASAGTAQVTTRYQILLHIFTRCQEELEKLISQETPASALLVKLLVSFFLSFFLSFFSP